MSYHSLNHLFLPHRASPLQKDSLAWSLRLVLQDHPMWVWCRQACNMDGELEKTSPLVNYLKQLDKGGMSYQAIERNWASHPAVCNISRSSQGHHWEHLCTGQILVNPASPPMQFVTPWAQEAHARALVAFQRRSTVEFDWNPNEWESVKKQCNWCESKCTYPEDVACINHLGPIPICHFECRPWDMLHKPVITP